MKWLTAMLIALLVAGLWPAAPARAAAPDIYLALGNSLAVGYEAPGNSDGQPGYPALLFQRLQALNPELELVNTGVVGETSATLISGGQLASAEATIASARGSGQCVGFLTVDIGGNDFGQILAGQTTPAAAIPQFRSNLAAILSRLRSAASNQVAGCSPRMAVMDYYNPYPGLPIPPGNQPLSDMYLPDLNGIIRSTAGDYGFAVTNVEAAFRGNEAELIYVNQGIYTNPLLRLPFTPWFETNVDFHPRPAGHQVIADEFWAALQVVPPVPALAELPDLIPATVSLVAPWTCGECALAGRQQAALAALPEPTTVGIEWLGAQLFNRVTRPILCWLLAMFQAGLNIYASTLNQLWIPALNTFFRLIYALFFWLTSAYANWWYLGEDMREILWSINGSLQLQASGAAGLALASGDIATAVLDAWLAVFTGALAPWQYLISLYLDTATQMVVVLVDLESYRPAQLDQIENYWLLGALKGMIRGISESQMGWWLSAQIGLFWLATGLYIIDEAAKL